MKNIFITVLVLIGISLSANAQEKSGREKKGDKFFFTYTFDKAIDSYSKTKNLTVQGQRNLAESYRMMKQNLESEETYAALIKGDKELKTEDYYNYAMVLKNSGKYSESNLWMNKFVDKNPTDLRSKSYRENKTLFDVLVKDNGKSKIREMEINTDSQDFGTSYYNNKVVYASSNASPKMIKRRYNWNNEPFLNLYVAEVVDGQLKNREFFDKKSNCKMHDGPASFNRSGTFMAYTKNGAKDKSKDKVVELQIFTRKFEAEEWTEPVAFELNKPVYNVGHPALTGNGQTMYFVSDMPGGFGGTDLYQSTRNEGGTWGKAENLGNVINTEGDEMFPFFNEVTKTLHFSSNGHYGLGAHDIFSSKGAGNTWGPVINAGAPLNTHFDDYALIIDTTSTKGYFSSNRTGGSGSDDIYGVDLLSEVSRQKIIEGIAMNGEKKTLPGTSIKLFDETEKEIAAANADSKGAYKFTVDTDKYFELTGNKANYLEGKTTANTFGTDSTVTANLYLTLEEVEEEEIIIVEDNVVVNEDLGPIVKLKPIYFDFDKSDITPKAAKELDKMIKVMNQFPSMEIELSSYTDCRGSKHYNNSLSQARAKSSADYIRERISLPNRISGKGAGESKLVNDCACEDEIVSSCTDQEHHMNRRTEFIVTKK